MRTPSLPARALYALPLLASLSLAGPLCHAVIARETALPNAASSPSFFIAQQLTDRLIRVRDLARLAPHEANALGHLTVAYLPDGPGPFKLSAERRAALLRRRVPGHTLRLLVEGPVRFMVPSGTARMGEVGRAGRECFALRQNLAAGDYVTQAGVTPQPCLHEGAPRLSIRYDATAGAPIAAEPLASGTYLGALTLREGSPVGKGQPMSLWVSEGQVRIAREVTTLQSTRAGAGVFVRTADGKVLSAPLARAPQGKAAP